MSIFYEYIGVDDVMLIRRECVKCLDSRDIVVLTRIKNQEPHTPECNYSQNVKQYNDEFVTN